MHVFNATDATLYFMIRISVHGVLLYKKTSNIFQFFTLPQ